MTASELYSTDEQFRQLIAKWIEDKRCPLCTGDYLREKDCPLQANCADWCSWFIDRWWWENFKRNEKVGVFPAYKMEQNKCLWMWLASTELVGEGELEMDSDRIPMAVNAKIKFIKEDYYFTSPQQALLTLLDSWALAEAAGHTLPVPTIGVIG